MQEGAIDSVVQDIINAKKTLALTGAGISVASGIPDFRSEGGFWSKFDPEEYCHIDAFRAQPEKVWVMLREMLELIIKAKPNPAHRGLVLMEEMGLISAVITQNVDGLHQAAGSKNVIEFHGTHRFLSCLDWGSRGKSPCSPCNSSHRDVRIVRSCLNPMSSFLESLFPERPMPWLTTRLSRAV